MVVVIISMYGAKISRTFEMTHLPSIDDEVFIGLQRAVVTRRWWNLELRNASILLRLTEINGNPWKDTVENWLCLLHQLGTDEWTFSGNFSENLEKAWRASR